MKCPKCETPIESVAVQRIAARSELHGRSVRAVAYCCEACEAVLAIESDPLERDTQIDEIKKASAKHASDMDVVLKKLTSLSAAVAALKPRQ